ARDSGASSQGHDVPRWRVILGIAHYAGHQRGIALVPSVDPRQRGGEPLGAVGDAAPKRGFWQRVAFVDEPGARHDQAALVGEVRIERVTLHTGALGNHAEGGRRRPKARMQFDSGLHDTLAGLGLLFGTSLLGVGPRQNFTARTRASIFTSAR